MRVDPVADQQDVYDDEGDEDRQQHLDRFLHPAQVQHHQHRDEGHAERDLPVVQICREQAEHGICARRDRDRDRQHVIHDQRRAGHEPRVTPDQLCRHLVAAAAVRKQLDHLVIGERNDEHGHRDGDRQIEPEVGVGAEGKIGLLGAISRRRQAVRAESHPGEKSDERDVVPGLRIEGIARLADQRFAQSRQARHASGKFVKAGKEGAAERLKS